jgi:YVTN family beta-propeller protein
LKDGNYLYVASNVSDSIQIIDVTTPASPTAV